MPERFQRDFQCEECGASTHRDLAQTVAAIRTAGMLRRVEKPDEDLVIELLATLSARLVCPECGRLGLNIREVDDQFEWPGDQRQCKRCSTPIPAERLEVFPETTLCVNCQSAGDAGQSGEDPEFCPRCGGLMQVQQAGGGGLARYLMKCSECGMKA